MGGYFGSGSNWLQPRPPEEEYDFRERLVELNSELSRLNRKAKEIELQINENIRQIIN